MTGGWQIGHLHSVGIRIQNYQKQEVGMRTWRLQVRHPNHCARLASKVRSTFGQPSAISLEKATEEFRKIFKRLAILFPYCLKNEQHKTRWLGDKWNFSSRIHSDSRYSKRNFLSPNSLCAYLVSSLAGFNSSSKIFINNCLERSSNLQEQIIKIQYTHKTSCIQLQLIK